MYHYIFDFFEYGTFAYISFQPHSLLFRQNFTGEITKRGTVINIGQRRKKIFVTGSSRGIGAQIARDAHQSGYEVILHGRTETEELIKLKKELGCEALVFDVSDWAAAENSICSLDQLDILVNCAGVNISASFDDLSQDDWQKVYSVNVFGLVGNKSLLKLLSCTEKARIVNIGSVKGRYSAVGRSLCFLKRRFQVTVAWQRVFTKYPSKLCCSGFVNTDMTEQTMSPRVKSQISSDYF